METVRQPHDRFCKSSIAADLLKAHLPPELFKRLDLNTLHLTDKSLSLPKLREMHCDMVHF